MGLRVGDAERWAVAVRLGVDLSEAVVAAFVGLRGSAGRDAERWAVAVRGGG